MAAVETDSTPIVRTTMICHLEGGGGFKRIPTGEVSGAVEILEYPAPACADQAADWSEVD